MDIATWIHNERIKRGLDQLGLARLSGVSTGTISRLENANSQPTLYAILQIFYGFRLGLPDFMRVMGLEGILPQHQGARKDKEGFLTIEDIEAFLQFYRADAKRATQVLYKTLEGVYLLAYEAAQSEKEKDDADGDLGIVQSMHNPFDLLPVPKRTSSDVLWQTYISGGILSLGDAGEYIRNAREKKDYSQRQLAIQAKTTHNVIGRLETGSIERIDLTVVLDLDRIIGIDDDILTI